MIDALGVTAIGLTASALLASTTLGMGTSAGAHSLERPATALVVQAALAGTWTLNLTRSRYPTGQAPKVQMLTYTLVAGGTRVVTTGIGADGNAMRVEFVIAYDDKDHPVTGLPFDAIRYTRTGERSASFVRSREGRVVQTGTREVSADGKTMTVKVTNVGSAGEEATSVAVYERR